MLAEWLLGERGDIELAKEEEPIDTQWTINVVDASICRNCDHLRSDEN